MQTSNLDNNGYKAYNTYLAIKQHFTSAYDYFKYNGKIKTNFESFKRRTDRFQFAKLERKHKSDLVPFIVSNALNDNLGWIGDLTSDEAEQIYLNWKRRIESLKYNFKCEMLGLRDYIELNEITFDDLFFIPENSHPILLQLILENKLSIETIVIMDKILTFSKKFNKKMVDDPVWMDYSRKIHKYSAFIAVDVDDYKKILRDVFL